MVLLIIALSFLVLMLGFLYSTSVKVWRGDERAVRKMRMSLAAAPFGNGVKDGMVRASAVLAAQLTCILGAVISGLIGMQGATRGEFTPGIIMAFCFLGGVVLLFFVQIAIICFNRPAFLVPPALRVERGSLQPLK